MDFFALLPATLRAGTAPFSVILFVVSAVLLVAGVLLRVRARVRLEHLENTSLRLIEFTHPHFPSAWVATTIALCTTTLMLSGLRTLAGVWPFTDPYQGLNLVSLFLVGGAVAILAELQWEGAKNFASAVLTGTAFSFLALTLSVATPGAALPGRELAIVLLAPSALTLETAISTPHPRGVFLTLVLTFAFWIVIYLLQ